MAKDLNHYQDKEDFIQLETDNHLSPHTTIFLLFCLVLESDALLISI